jgi:hypothetical protein
VRRTLSQGESPVKSEAARAQVGEFWFLAAEPRNDVPPNGNEGRSSKASRVEREYLDLKDLAAYSGLSERQLRKYINLQPGDALPWRRPGRKVLVKRDEFDIWFAQYRQRGKSVLTKVLRELGLDPERLPETRPPRSPRERTGRSSTR